ncbi:PepSY-associated TM helix domain-containing protein [Sphingomonas phyllosphaerae]|uniref:PepSY-associated TM helix domain-containing protein n=1 Tax=Sphingomonas phyllosphaerae TaxID=257003 RepID=UPI0004236EE0|nr:PepSY-associated TM helix domain-containing protein [Sphingomonas phyllosphaerae]
MTRSLRQSMAWIHSWLGLLAGWILFAMFLTGTASYFRPEITRWMQPEMPVNHTPAAIAAQSAVAQLSRDGIRDQQWFIQLPNERDVVTHVYATPKPDAAEAKDKKPGKRRKRADEQVLAPATGAPIHARDTRGGEHFYRFHFQLQLPHPWGRWLAGVCAMFMLGAIISGVVTHKRIFADFFTLRWNKGQRSWLDAHNVSAVLALPYHAVITYTGLMTLVLMYLPYPIAINYKQPLDFGREAYGLPQDAVATGRATPLVPIAPLVRDAEARLQRPAARVVVQQPGDAAAIVAVTGAAQSSLNARAGTVVYSGATGALIQPPSGAGTGVSSVGVMLGLHLAQYAAPALRWVLFLLGLTGAAMVGTGLLLWTAARRKPGAKPFFGLRLVERLNIATIAGLPIGMGAYLLANRVIPAAAEGRAAAEVATMFYVWGGAAVLQLLRPAKQAWAILFATGAAVYAAIPIANALTTSRGLTASWRAGDQLFMSFDLALLGIAALLGVAAWRAARPRPAQVSRRAREMVHV